jgi:hypothetical protein
MIGFAGIRSKLYREGRLDVAPRAAQLVPVRIAEVVNDERPPTRVCAGVIVVEVGRARIRIEGAVDAENLRLNNVFHGPVAGELHGFLQFKRSLGYGYARAEFALREFDRFLSDYAAKNRRWQLDQAAIEWLSSKPERKPVSVSGDAAILRQFFAYLRRLPNHRVVEPLWPQLPTESSFVPNYLSEQNILNLLELCAGLKRPRSRAKLYRALLLILYCTGLRFGEALHLRMRDVDTRSGVLFVDIFKGRARWVPFHRSLCRELAILQTAGSTRPLDQTRASSLALTNGSCRLRPLVARYAVCLLWPA